MAVPLGGSVPPVPSQGNAGHVTMVGALGLVGVVAAMMVEGFVDGAAFLAFVQEVLVPQLQAGQVVVLDNLKAHKWQEYARRLKLWAPGSLLPLSPASLLECWSTSGVLRRARRWSPLAAIRGCAPPTGAEGWFTCWLSRSIH